MVSATAFTALGLSQPLMRSNSPAIDGVKLYTAADLQFGAALNDRRDRASDRLLKYVVLLENQSARDIAGYDIHWRCQDNGGKKVRHVTLF
jgi:hypothetical protein